MKHTNETYQINKKEPHPHRAGLYSLERDGRGTGAWAAEGVKFHDDCHIRGGEFRGGVFWGGEFRGGVFEGGVFRGGEFRGGEFRDGVFRGGEFWGGVFRGGVFWGGVFRGGVFRGGVFRGGEFWGGWLPLQIQGSQHMLNIPDGQNIRIGCMELSPAEWLDHYEEIGRKEGYSPDQIAEYREYIELAARHIERARGES